MTQTRERSSFFRTCSSAFTLDAIQVCVKACEQLALATRWKLCPAKYNQPLDQRSRARASTDQATMNYSGWLCAQTGDSGAVRLSWPEVCLTRGNTAFVSRLCKPDDTDGGICSLNNYRANWSALTNERDIFHARMPRDVTGFAGECQITNCKLEQAYCEGKGHRLASRGVRRTTRARQKCTDSPRLFPPAPQAAAVITVNHPYILTRGCWRTT